MTDGSGSGWAGITGIKDIALIDAKALTEVASDKALQEPQAEEARAGPLHRDPRAARQRALPVAHDRHLQRGGVDRRRRWRRGRRAAGGGRACAGGAPGGGAGGGGGGGGFGGGGGGAFMAGKKPGDKIFSDLFTLKSDIGNPILRQSPILNDNRPATPVTWVENGVLRNFGAGTARHRQHEPGAWKAATCRSPT